MFLTVLRHFSFSPVQRDFFFSRKTRNQLCKTPALISREMQSKSNLIFAVIGSTSLPSSRHVGKDKGGTVSAVQDVSEEPMASHKKTACAIAIRGTVRCSTSDIPRSTESCFKSLGSETVPMMTSESKLSRHRSKCSGPCWNASVSRANRGLLSPRWNPTFDLAFGSARC